MILLCTGGMKKNRKRTWLRFWRGSKRIACENSCFSSLFAAGTATQRQKFHTDDVNQCLHNKCKFFQKMFPVVDFSKVLCSFANELQQNSKASSREDYIPEILTVSLDWFIAFLHLRLHLTFVASCILSVIRKQELKQCIYSVDQSTLLTGFRTDFTSSVWNFCRWVAKLPPRETSPAAKREEKRLFSQARREEFNPKCRQVHISYISK